LDHAAELFFEGSNGWFEVIDPVPPIEPESSLRRLGVLSRALADLISRTRVDYGLD
jgi:hypothetical protein